MILVGCTVVVEAGVGFVLADDVVLNVNEYMNYVWWLELPVLPTWQHVAETLHELAQHSNTP